VEETKTAYKFLVGKPLGKHQFKKLRQEESII
jgi:hypothetical protein